VAIKKYLALHKLKPLKPVMPQFGLNVASYQSGAAFVIIVIARYMWGLPFEQFAQSVNRLCIELFDYWNSYFLNVNKASHPSMSVNFVDATSLQTVPSTLSTPSEGHEVTQEVKPGLSRKAKIYIGVYICVAVACFLATGYFPF